MHKVIAIDGPSGSGKSTMAKKLAQSLGLLYIDTGAMYRALAYFAHKKNIPYEEGAKLLEFLIGLDIQYGVSESQLIIINGEDLTKIIREHNVSALASEFSQIPIVRSFLLSFQRNLGEVEVCVMEGRDIGTVVFPDAFCKVFVTASPEVRARRRLDQLKERADASELTYEGVLKDVIERDRLDTNRAVSPLKVAEGAIYLDTSEMEEDEVLQKLIETSRLKGQEAGLSI
ncbi:MAG: (d)CMP kinase [Bacteriovoracaceae bacterium]|nr:(d)CMP kinase [Bacteriovoracaceae bacterium]